MVIISAHHAMTVICKIQIGPDRNHYEYNRSATQDGTRWIGIRGSPYAAAGEKLVLVMMEDESSLRGFGWIAFDTSNENFNPLHEGRAVFKAHNIGAPPDWQGEWFFATKVLERKGPSGQSSQEAIMNS